MNLRLALLMIVGATLASNGAGADAIVAFDIDAPGYQETQVAHIGQGMVSVRNPGGAQNTDAVYDQKSDHVIMIEHDRRSYMILDEATVDDFAGQAEGIASMIQAQLENVSPEQRAQMEQMMENMGLGSIAQQPAAPPELEYLKTAESRTVNGYPCMVYRVLEDGRPNTEMCIASRDALPLQDDDYATLRAMHRFYQRLASKTAALIGDLGPSFPDLAAEQIEGLPITVHDIDDDITVTLTRIELDRVDPALFKVPDGYTESQLPTIAQ